MNLDTTNDGSQMYTAVNLAVPDVVAGSGNGAQLRATTSPPAQHFFQHRSPQADTPTSDSSVQRRESSQPEETTRLLSQPVLEHNSSLPIRPIQDHQLGQQRRFASTGSATTGLRTETDQATAAVFIGVDNLPPLQPAERKRDKLKRILREKGARVLGGAVAVGMFVFKVVEYC